MSYDVFISYRRDAGAAEARLLRQALMGRGKRVFLDVTDLRRGYFDETLLQQIGDAPNFVVILTRGALDRCTEAEGEGDWLRQEIAHAIRTNRNIIPVMLEGFQFPAHLPDDLANLPRHQGVSYSHQYFDAMIESIVLGLDTRSGVESPPARIVQPRTAAPANRFSVLSKWRFVTLVAIAAVAIWIAYALTHRGTSTETSPDHVERQTSWDAAYKRGDHYYNLGEYDNAIAAYKEAAQLAPNEDWIHERLADTYRIKGDMDNAIKEYLEWRRTCKICSVSGGLEVIDREYKRRTGNIKP